MAHRAVAENRDPIRSAQGLRTIFKGRASRIVGTPKRAITYKPDSSMTYKAERDETVLAIMRAHRLRMADDLICKAIIWQTHGNPTLEIPTLEAFLFADLLKQSAARMLEETA